MTLTEPEASLLRNLKILIAETDYLCWPGDGTVGCHFCRSFCQEGETTLPELFEHDEDCVIGHTLKLIDILEEHSA